MITLIPDVPENIAAFKATGEVTKEDFECTVVPHVEAVTNTFGELNYLFYVDTTPGNFSAGAWFEDALLGLKNLFKWNRVAIVTDQKTIQRFTAIFSVVMPGEVKFFPKKNLSNAIFWCAKGDEVDDISD